MRSLCHAIQNKLLASLQESDLALWLPHFEVVTMDRGAVFYEAGDFLSHVYFPTTSTVSLLYVMESGACAEIAVVGNEGIVGISVFMGGQSTPSRMLVRNVGQAMRLEASLLMSGFSKGGKTQRLLLLYTQALITQMMQMVACNQHHSLEERLCRCLMQSLDRLPSGEIAMTQEVLANLLGVRREGVAQAAGRLQIAGIISYQRGHIKVLDRDQLEKRSCECYGIVKAEYDRLLTFPKDSSHGFNLSGRTNFGVVDGH
jgi:CRP-like cAMP-binding protein